MKIARQPYKTLWVLVDKRGTILERNHFPERGSLRDGTYKTAEPQFSFYGDRATARWQIAALRADMTAEAWKTWQFKAVKYERKD